MGKAAKGFELGEDAQEHSSVYRSNFVGGVS